MHDIESIKLTQQKILSHVDDGRPVEVGMQVQTSNHLVRLHFKWRGRERQGKKAQGVVNPEAEVTDVRIR